MERARLAERRTLFVAAAAVSALVVFSVAAIWATRDAPTGPVVAAVPSVELFETEPDESTPTSAGPATASTDLVAMTSTTAPAPASTIATTPSTTEPERLATLVEGDTGIDVLVTQRMLNLVIEAGLAADGLYGPATTEAIETFQRSVELPVTGEADDATRTMLSEIDAGRSILTPSWPLPTIGDGGADDCQVVVIGDSLMAGVERLHTDRLAEIGCTAAVDGAGGRTMSFGWQCSVLGADGRWSTVVLSDPPPGNDSCDRSGLELLRTWSNARALGDIVVVALGTNDAVVYSEPSWIERWERAAAYADTRPMIMVTTRARPDSPSAPLQAVYSEALRQWCDSVERCVLADWALTDEANDPVSYRDSVHLVDAATDARASFIRDAVAALLTGRPAPNPVPLPVPPPRGRPLRR
jgi:peptidoglycan hydrolase-like protein with peptidoglycan-binding domain